MLHPKISIITPSFNQAEFIEKTITSVLDQNYPNLEYIIIDGGSTDGSVEIIKKYQDSIAYWVSERDRGQSDAINKGLQKATGEVINWLNSDDYYEPDTLHTVGKAFRNPEITCLIGKSNLFKVESQPFTQTNGTDVYLENLAKTLGWARIDQPETFFRKSAIDKMGLLNEDFHYVMDKEWWMRYLLIFGLKGIHRIDDILVNFRLHEDSKTVSQSGGFTTESGSLYHNLAAELSWTEAKKVLSNLVEISDKHTLKVPSSTDWELLKSAVNYYLLYLADYFYSIDKRTKSKKLLNVIDPALLDRADVRQFKKLRLRNTLLPVWIKKLKNS